MSQDMKMSEGANTADANSADPASISSTSTSAAAPATVPQQNSNGGPKPQQPQRSFETSTVNPTKDASREIMSAERKKMMDILEHRCMLLERMQLCRKATEARLSLYAKNSNPKAAKDALLGTGQPTPAPMTTEETLTASRKKMFPNKKEEIQSYKDLCKYAMGYTAKKPPPKPSVPPARAISLRTGSSVGNKMKAAVATLTTNVGWISDSSSSASNKVKQSSIITDLMAPGPSATAAVMVKDVTNSQTVIKNVAVPIQRVNPGGPTQNLPLHKSTPPINGIQKFLIPAGKQKQQGASPNPPSSILPNAKASPLPTINNNNVKRASSTTGSVLGKQVKKKKSQSGKKNTSKNVRSSSSMSASEAPAAANVPLHHGLRGYGQPPKGKSGAVHANGRDSHNYTSRIICPEVDKLREKRREIVMKLDNLMRNKYADVLSKGGDPPPLEPLNTINGRSGQIAPHRLISSQKGKRLSSFSPPQPQHQQPHVIISDNPYSSGKKLSWKIFMNASVPPCVLPERRKTQWDYVLEEMRWLSTDFVEENKWKKASAKAISAAVQTYHHETSPKRKLSVSKKSVEKLSSIEKKHISDVEMVDVGNYAVDEDESMEETSETESIVDDHVSKLEFVDPSASDIKSSRTIAIAMSALIGDHWGLTGISTKTGMPPDDSQYAAAFSRYHKLCQADLESKENGAAAINVSRDADVAMENRRPPDELLLLSSEKKQLAFDEIENEIQSYLQKVERMRSQLPTELNKFHDDLSGSLDESVLELQQHQLEALQFTEALWNEDDNDVTLSGTVINGHFGSGKTFSAGTLFWRRKSKGPQLLLCPAASLIRWRHELRHFSGLNVLTFGFNGWSFDGHAGETESGFNQNDVLLCNLAAVENLWSKRSRGKVEFATIVVDIRCSTLLPALQSSNTQTQSNLALKKRKNEVSLERESSYSHVIAKEVYSGDWWNGIIQHLVSNRTKCAILEMSGVVEGHDFDPKSMPLPNKEKADISSFKVAFLFHRLFHSKHNAYGRRAFWWARKHYNTLKKHSFEVNDSEVDLSGGVRGVLMQLMKTVAYNEELTEEDIGDIVSTCIPKWTVHTCPLMSVQREAYDRACAFSRGLLQLQFDDFGRRIESDFSDSHISSAKCLLRLRRTCFHSDLHDFACPAHKTSAPKERLNILGTVVSRKNGNIQNDTSSSQPNISLAKDLLEKSSKLRQLLNILCKDCGFDVPGKNFLLDMKQRNYKKRSNKRKKVLILATLPEVLLLVSSFLNALGIAHELLTPTSCLPGPSSVGMSQAFSQPTAESVLSWVHCQQSVSRFDDIFLHKEALKVGMGTNILVSSPKTLGSTSLGLSASNAEVVISVDEDWSGRCDLQTYSILRKNRTRNMLKATGRKYIKLVAEDTCEESFLTVEKKARGKTSIQALPMMISLLKNVCLDHNGDIVATSTPLLGKNMLRYTSVPLNDVFRTDEFPLGTLSGQPPLFLTDCLNESSKGRDDCDLEKFGDKIPVLFDDTINEPSYVQTIGGRANALSFGRALLKIESMTYATIGSLWHCYAGDRLKTNVQDLDCFTSSRLSACRDICSQPVQRYIIFMKLQNTNDNASSKVEKLNENTKKPRVPRSSASDKTPTESKNTEDTSKIVAEVKTSSHVVPNWLKPEEIATALIWYSVKHHGIDEDQDKEITHVENSEKRRINSYVSSYLSMQRNYDGNQGCESLVYFPPIFPGLLQAKRYSESETKPLSQPLVTNSMKPVVSQGKKRKTSEDSKLPNSKRHRSNHHHVSPLPDFAEGVSTITQSQSSFQQQNSLSKEMVNDLSVMADADFMDNDNDFFDGDFLPDLTINEEDIPIDIPDDDDPVEAAVVTKPNLDEDFGILGPGLLPPLEDSIQSAMKCNGYSNLYSYWLDPFEPLSSNAKSPANNEDDMVFSRTTVATPKLDSMLLRVKKITRNRKQSSNLSMQVSSVLPMPQQHMGSVVPNGGFDQYQSGSQLLPQKKKKKGGADKRTSIGSASLFPPNTSFPPMQIDNHMVPHNMGMMPKDFAKSRNQGDPPSAFDAFCRSGIAPTRLHHRLEDIIDAEKISSAQNQISSSAILSPNIQSAVQTSQSFIRELQHDEITGDAARNTAKEQKESFCCGSLVSSDVNFGPFAVSVVPETSIKEASHPLEPHIGIKLPMGVKVHKSIDSFTRSIDMWNKDEDKRLDFYAKNFGFNWHAVSLAMTLKSTFSSCLDTETILNPIRSARQCKERWEFLNPSKAQISDMDPISIVKGRTVQSDDIEEVNDAQVQGGVLFDQSRLSTSKKAADTARQEVGGTISDRLRKLKTASLKRHHVPLTVPGYTAGSRDLPIVPSHPSHSQSVQEAIAASAAPSGMVPPRAEMWPLQFLDLTEKQHLQVEKLKNPTASTAQPPSQQQQVLQRQPPTPQRHSSVPTRQAPVPQRQAQVPQRQVAVQQRQAPVPQRQVTVQQRQAPVSQRQAPVQPRQTVAPQRQAPVQPRPASISQRQVTGQPRPAQIPQRQSSIPQRQVQVPIPPRQTPAPSRQIAVPPPMQVSIPQQQVQQGPPRPSPVKQRPAPVPTQAPHAKIIHVTAAHTPHAGTANPNAVQRPPQMIARPQQSVMPVQPTPLVRPAVVQTGLPPPVVPPKTAAYANQVQPEPGAGGSGRPAANTKR